MKLCKDCRWAVNTLPEIATTTMYWECNHPTSLLPSPGPDLVTGETPPPIQLSCTHARSSGRSLLGDRDPCGLQAKHWEPKTDAPEPPEVVGFGEASR